MKVENKVYKSYFEEIINHLVTIHNLDPESLLRKLKELKIEELNIEVKNYEEKIGIFDKGFKELVESSEETIKIIDEFYESKDELIDQYNK